MNKVIATIQLAQGRVGFYDELSHIHLTIASPVAQVYSGTNCARLRRAVKNGVIRLLDGTLGQDVAPFKVVKVGNKLKLVSNAAEAMKPVIAEAAAPVQGAEVKDGGNLEEAAAAPEEVKADEETPAEKAEEDAVEEETVEKAEAEEEKPKKKSRRKTKKAE